MAENIARKILKAFLGEYLEEIDSEQICIGLWSGDLSLENLKLKATAFDQFDLPVKVKFGKVGKLKLALPYKSIIIGRSSQVYLELENITIYLKSNGKENWNFIDYSNFDYKYNCIKSLVENLIFQIKIAENPNINDTYLNRMINNIIDNAIISIKNIVVIYEDVDSNTNFNFFFGIELQEISINNSPLNSNGIKEFESETVKELKVDSVKCSKIFKIIDFSIYMIPILKGKTVNFSSKNYGSDLINLLNDSPNYTKDELISKSDSISNYNIIKPISLNLKFIRNDNISNLLPKYLISLDINAIDIEIEKKQYICLLKLNEFFSSYQKFLINCYYYRRIQAGKPIKKSNIRKGEYLLSIFKFYANKIMTIIHQRKKGILALKSKTDELAVKKAFFIERFSNFYLNPGKLTENDNLEMIEIIRFIDNEIITEWVKEIIPIIYKNQKQLEVSTGFFGGIKSYFASSAIENINLENSFVKEENDLSYIISAKINYCSASLSEIQKSQIHKIIDSNKFTIRNIQFMFENRIDLMKLKASINEIKLCSISKFNSNIFTNELMIPMNSEIKEKTFHFQFFNDFKNQKFIKIFLQSHSIIYSQKFIQIISRFIDENDFDFEIKNVISSHFLHSDIVPDKKQQIELKLKLELFIDSQMIILPFNRKSINESDIFVVTLGSLDLKNEYGADQITNYIISIDNINMIYSESYENWIEKYSKGEKVPSSNEILQNISLNMKIAIEDSSNGFTEISTNLSPINIILNKKTFSKFQVTNEIFKTPEDDDIWEHIHFNKKQIIDSSSKKGTIKFLNKITGNWSQYYCILSGGFLYFFEKPDHPKPSFYISIKNANLVDCFEETKVEFSFKIFTETNKNFIAVSGERLYNEWKNSLNERIKEIKDFSENMIERSFVNKSSLTNRNTESEFRKYHSLVKRHLNNETGQYLKFSFKIPSFNLSLETVKLESKYFNELLIFNLSIFTFSLTFNTDALVSKLNLELSRINFDSNYKIDSIDNSHHEKIFWNSLSDDNYLVSLEFLMIDDKFYDYYLNNTERFSDLKEITNLVKGKIQLILNFGFINFNFNPLIIKSLVNFLNSCDSDTNSQIKDENKSKSEDVEQINLKTISCHGEKGKDIYLMVNLKSLQIELMNQKSQMLFYSFLLSESSFQFNKFIDHQEIELMLGKFLINDFSNFPQNFKSVEEQSINNFPFNVITGTLDSEKQISLKLKLIFMNSHNCQYFNELSPSTTNLYLNIESIFIYYKNKVIMRFLDFVNEDLINLFSNNDTENNKLIEKKEFKDKTINDSLDFLFFKVEIENPQLILMDIFNENNCFTLDFGKINLHNSVTIVEKKIDFSEILIDFKDTNIKSSKNLEICKPFSISLKIKSKLNNFNDDDPITTINTFSTNIDIQLFKQDYRDLMIIFSNNILYEDNFDNYYFPGKSLPDLDSTNSIISNLNSKILDLEVYNELFRFKLINEKTKIIEVDLLLEDFRFKYESFPERTNFNILSRSIFIKELTDDSSEVMLFYNKKGDIKERPKSYSQLNIIVAISKDFNEVVIFLDDLKIFIDLRILNFFTDYFEDSWKDSVNTVNSQNSSEPQVQLKEISKQNPSLSYDLKLSINNNIIFFKSEDHFKTQRILATEGDLLCQARYSIKSEAENANFDILLSNVNLYSTIVNEFNSNFEEYEKRTLIDHTNITTNLKYSKIDLNKKVNLFSEYERIMLKLTYADISFITKCLMINANDLTSQNTKKEEVKIESKSETVEENLNIEVCLISKGVEILMINDLEKKYYPIIKFNLNEYKIYVISHNFNESLDINIMSSISINFFNMKISLWEPFIENFLINFTYQFKLGIDKVPNQNLILNLSDLNLNLSEEFINLILYSSQILTEDIKNTLQNKKEGNSLKDTINISNFLVKNYSGESIKFKKNDGIFKEQIVENNCEFDLSELFTSENNRNYFNNDDVSSGLFIDIIEFIESEISLKKLNLNKNKSKEIQMIKDGIKSYPFIFSVEIDHTNKYYSFFSSIMIENFCNLNIILLIFDKDNSIIEKININSGSKLGIPQKYFNYNFGFSYEDEIFSLNYSLIQVQNIEELTQELFFKNSSFNLNIYKEKAFNSKIYYSKIDIESKFKIENKLMFDLEFRLPNQTNGYIIKPNEILQVNDLIKSDKELILTVKNNEGSFYENNTLTFKRIIDYSLQNLKDEELELDLTLIDYANPEETISFKAIIYRRKSSIYFCLLNEYYFVNSTTLSNVEVIYTSKIKISKQFNFSKNIDGKYQNLNFFILPKLYEKFRIICGELSSEDVLLSVENLAVNKDIELKNETETHYQFVLERNIYYLQFNRIKKIDVLILKPKFNIKNNLNNQIIIKNPYEETITIEKQEIKEYHFKYKNNKKVSKQIAFSLLNNNIKEITQISDWSDYFDLQKKLDYSLCLKESMLLNPLNIPITELKLNKYFQVNISLDPSNLINCINFTETDLNNTNIIVKNECENFSVQIFQINKNSKSQRIYDIKSNQNEIFSWSNITIHKYIKIDLFMKNTSKSCEYYVFDYENCDHNYFYYFETSNVSLNVFYEGHQRVILFKEENKLDKKILKKETPITKYLNDFLISIGNINISFISSIDSKRKEIFNINFNGIILLIQEEERNKLNYKNIHFKLKNMQIDNYYSQNTPYKIILFKLHEEDKADEDFIELSVEIKKDTKINYIFIEKFDFLIQSFALCLDSDFLYKIVTILKSLGVFLDKSFVYESPQLIFSEILKFNHFEFEANKKDKNNIYINYIRTSPINFLLSFKNIDDKFFNEINLTNKLLTNVIDLFTNNDKVNIKLKAIEMKKVFGNSTKIISLIKDYYKFNLMTQSVKLLFSIDILGNPVKLLENIAGGVKDFFYMPIQGFVKGPIDMIKGGAYGTKSLVSHTLGGALDSTQKITSSLGKNILKLTEAEEYLFERQKIINYDNNSSLNKKIIYSFKFLLLGLKYGIRDLFVIPYKYSQKNNLRDIIKGIIFALTSIIIKPINGGLDFISFLSGGLAIDFLKNYEKSYLKIKNLRNERILWGKLKKVKPIDFDDHFVNYLIECPNYEMIIPPFLKFPLHFHNCFIYYSFDVSHQINDEHLYNMILFVNDFLLIYNFSTRTIDQTIKMGNIKEVKVNKKKIEIIYFSKENKENKDNNTLFMFENTNPFSTYQLNFEFEELKLKFLSNLEFIQKRLKLK